MKLNGKATDVPTEIANLFAEHFESVYTYNNTHSHIDQNCNCTNHITITIEEIKTAILSLCENKTSSPDNIPFIFLQTNMLRNH